MALESIALIPSGVKATKVYSQLPVNGNGDFTFDRGTSTDQTRVNKNGLIESVAQDVPRLDYLDGGCPSLLLEPASTNLITYSEELDNVYWVKTGVTTTANVALSPDGSVNMDRLTDDGANSAHHILRNVGNQTGACAISFFVKTTGRGYVACSLVYNANSRGVGVIIDLSNNSVYDSQESSATWSVDIDDYDNDFKRIKLTATNTVDNLLNTMTVSTFDGESYTWSAGYRTPSFQGTSNTIDVWGLQFENLSYATSYIPTSGATATRNSETCNGAGTTAEINSQEGVLFFEGRALADDLSFRVLSLNSGATSDRVVLGYNNVSNTIYTFIDSSSSPQGSITHSVIDITNYSKVAVKYSLNNVEFYVNGILIGVNTSATMPIGLSDLDFDSGIGGSTFYGRVKKLSVYDDTTTDLETLTGFTSFAEMATYLSYS